MSTASSLLLVAPDAGVESVGLGSSDALARQFKTSSVKVSSITDPVKPLSLASEAVDASPLWLLSEACKRAAGRPYAVGICERLHQSNMESLLLSQNFEITPCWFVCRQARLLEGLPFEPGVELLGEHGEVLGRKAVMMIEMRLVS